MREKLKHRLSWWPQRNSRFEDQVRVQYTVNTNHYLAGSIWMRIWLLVKKAWIKVLKHFGLVVILTIWAWPGLNDDIRNSGIPLRIIADSVLDIVYDLDEICNRRALEMTKSRRHKRLFLIAHGALSYMTYGVFWALMLCFTHSIRRTDINLRLKRSSWAPDSHLQHDEKSKVF